VIFEFSYVNVISLNSNNCPCNYCIIKYSKGKEINMNEFIIVIGLVENLKNLTNKAEKINLTKLILF
jgi:tRNA A37 methylthiotransferase MiaB